MKLIQDLEIDGNFSVEITGSQQTKTAVILVHGFGVKRDSRGLFLDIESLVSGSMLSVRGDFSHIADDKCIAIPFSEQCKRLLAIINFVKDEYQINKFIYIGHSQGCITIGKANPKYAKIFLLAPPVISPFNEFIKTSGWQKPGSYLDLQGDSRLVRSDLTIDVKAEFWDEFKTINAESLYLGLAKKNKVQIVFSGADEILGQQKITMDIPTITISNADHDFNGLSRSELLKFIINKLK